MEQPREKRIRSIPIDYEIFVRLWSRNNTYKDLQADIYAETGILYPFVRFSNLSARLRRMGVNLAVYPPHLPEPIDVAKLNKIITTTKKKPEKK